MIRRPLLLSLLILAGPMALLANADIRGHWTNGWEEYAAMRVDDSTWHFEGAYLHEGGLRFRLKVAGDSSFFVSAPEPGVNPSHGNKGDRVVYRVVDGQRVLLFYSKAGTIEDVFTIIPWKEKLEDMVPANKTAFELSGKYTDAQTGSEILFYPTRPEAAGLLSPSDVYYFETGYDIPRNILHFKNDIRFWYEITDSSLELYQVLGKEEDEESCEKGKKLRTLKRIGWIDQTKGKQPGRYGFASTILLTPMNLSYFSANERRIMRNEIYARHGYIFKSPELQAYFTAQPWYKPVEGAGEAQLTELEKLNAWIIADRGAQPRGH